jgi:hypothetical protein
MIITADTFNEKFYSLVLNLDMIITNYFEYIIFHLFLYEMLT